MLVECKINRIEEVHCQWLDENSGSYFSNMESRITIGKKYVVHGIQFSESPLIFIYEEKDERIPFAFPLSCFEVVDTRLSRHFDLGSITEYQMISPKVVPFVSFKEWAGNPNLWLELVEGDYEDLFFDYRNKLEMEFHNPEMTISNESVIAIEERWVLCPSCNSSWEIDLRDELTICSSCKTVFDARNR